MSTEQNSDKSEKALRIGSVVFNAADYLYETCEIGKKTMCKCKCDEDCREHSEVELRHRNRNKHPKNIGYGSGGQMVYIK